MRRASGAAAGRPAFILVVVLAVLVLLTLACYEFADRSVNERLAVSRRVKLAQARAAAMSGVDSVLAMAADPAFDLSVLTPEQREELFRDVPVTEDGAVTFRVIDPLSPADAILFGPRSEGGKINLNALAEASVDEADARELMLGLPGIDEATADATLDLIDANAEPRAFGAESDAGGGTVRNLPINTLDDLLAVPGVTAALLYGEDADADGVLDPGENDGDASAPPDNADGILDLGWQAIITVAGRETNRQADGTPRINLNADDVQTTAADAEAIFGAEVGQAIRTLREEQAGDGQSSNAQAGGGQTGGGQTGGGQTGSGQSGGGQSGGGQSGDDAGASADGASSNGEGGRIADISQLFRIDSESDPTLLDPAAYSPDVLAQMYDVLSVTDAETVAGRIDINAAPLEVLIGLPTFDEARAQEVFDGAGTWQSPMDLVTVGLLTVEDLQRAGPLLTTRSRTYAFSSFGSVSGGPVVRVDAIIDAAAWPPRILRLTDLSRLGPGRELNTVRPAIDGGESPAVTQAEDR